MQLKENPTRDKQLVGFNFVNIVFFCGLLLHVYLNETIKSIKLLFVAEVTLHPLAPLYLAEQAILGSLVGVYQLQYHGS